MRLRLRLRLPRANLMGPRSAGATLACISLVLLPSYRADASNEEVAELRRLLRELKAENRALSRRLGALESAQEASKAQQPTRARTQERSTTPAPSAPTPTAGAAAAPAAQTLPEPRDTSKMGIAERVKELEAGWAANENATRQIIRDTLARSGPKINSFLALSGALEFVGSRSREFGGPVRDRLTVGTAELDFDIRISDWLSGAVVANWESGSGPTSPTTSLVTSTALASTTLASTIDRFTLDRTHVFIGDFTQFPIAARVGRETLHFGTTTGVARLDTLSIGTPLTTEVFENRQVAAGLEFAWPVPPLGPPPAPVVVPPVRPLVVGPMVNQFAQAVGYKPLPQRIFPPAPVRFPVTPSPFYGSITAYKGNEEMLQNRLLNNYNASLGYRTGGHCGLPYEQLMTSLVCPWTFDVHVDYNTSMFDSRFLGTSYRPFLNQIGQIGGVAASVKASFGPFALVGEVNKAVETARFIDGLGVLRNITPMAWQLSLAYQFDWNPWVREIGQQGTFVSVAYSGSRDMAGVTDVSTGTATRVGFVPQHRFLATAGEWPIDGLRLMVEYSANWDYPVSAGGTGQLAHGVFGSVQLNF
jgi:hypothetical protein